MSKVMSMLKKIFLVIILIIIAFLAVQVINATKHKMIVNVKEGENITGVNPTTEKLDFGDLSRNNGMTRYITLKSEGNVPTYVVIWKFGSISDLVTVDRNFFTLEPGKEVKVAFEITIPPSAQIKQYSGWVWIFRFPKI